MLRLCNLRTPDRGQFYGRQIDRIWSFAKTEQGKSVRSVLTQEADQLPVVVRPRLHDDRRIDHGQGSVSYRGATFERRLCVLIEMVDRLSSRGLSALIEPLSQRMFVEWQQEGINITEAVELLRALDRAKSPTIGDTRALKTNISKTLLGKAQKGCWSSELRELISVFDLQDVSNREALQRAFQNFEQKCFREDLSECRSLEQFDGLLEELDLFNRTLGVPVGRMSERVHESRVEFEEQKSTYEDHMADEWKERWQEERATERSISEMFNSLRADRA
jgi:hypothetical protein